MKVGQVIKIHSGIYSVLCGGEIVRCSARGSLKIKSDGIITGDFVQIDEGARTVDKVLERKNSFIRPSVANVDAVNVVVASPPRPDFIMLDKLLLTLSSKDVEIIITVNKSDLSECVYDEVLANYSDAGYKIFLVSAETREGLDDLKRELKGKLVAFAGQSAVGKSSLVNALFGLKLKTNDVSDKTQRGRHTTTVSEIHECGEYRVADTPGFSVLKPDIKPEEVALYYPEYYQRLPQCKFRLCTHSGEPDCKVIEDVNAGVLSKERYSRYVQILDEIKKENSKY